MSATGKLGLPPGGAKENIDASSKPAQPAKTNPDYPLVFAAGSVGSVVLMAVAVAPLYNNLGNA